MQHYLREHFCGINYQTILRKQNPWYISKIKFGDGQEDHVLVESALKLSTFRKCTYVKKKNFFKSVVIYIYMCIYIYIYIYIYMYIYLAILINISLIIYLPVIIAFIY